MIWNKCGVITRHMILDLHQKFPLLLLPHPPFDWFYISDLGGEGGWEGGGTSWLLGNSISSWQIVLGCRNGGIFVSWGNHCLCWKMISKILLLTPRALASSLVINSLLRSSGIFFFVILIDSTELSTLSLFLYLSPLLLRINFTGFRIEDLRLFSSSSLFSALSLLIFGARWSRWR